MTFNQLPELYNQPLSIENIRILRGANYFSGDKVIVLRLNLNRFDEVFTNKIEGFENKLKTAIPSLIEHHCSPGHRGGFLERVAEGTLLGHVTEHVAIELQTLAGMDVSFGKTRKTASPGIYNVVFRYFIPECGVLSAQLAVHIVNSILLNNNIQLHDYIEMLEQLRHDNLTLQPESNPNLIAITGSKGKSEVAALLRQAMILSDTENSNDTLQSLMEVYDYNKLIVKIPLEQIMMEGLFYSEALLGIVLNVNNNHLGEYDLTTIEDIAYAKSVVAEQVVKHGYAVLNADDPYVIEMSNRVNSRLALFSKYNDNEHIQALKKSIKDVAVTLDNGEIIVYHHNNRHNIIKLDDVLYYKRQPSIMRLENLLAVCTCLYCMQKKPDGLANVLNKLVL